MVKAAATLGLLLAVSLQAHGLSQPQACSLLNQIRAEMSVTASNIANVSTTRTPEGGPYRVQKLVCEDASCITQSLLKVKIAYEPDHPDANEEGYVDYPDIDLSIEKSNMRKLTEDYDYASNICFSNN